MTLLASVLSLVAEEGGAVAAASGRDVQGLWYRHWEAVDPALADRLHEGAPVQPFTLSPLMGLPHPRRGRIAVAAGTEAWVRVAALTGELTAQLAARWLPRLPATVSLGGLRWRVVGHTEDRDAHPWAGRADAQALAERHLLGAQPGRRWRLRFATPTAFRSAAGHLPFPLPGALAGSWLRRWAALGPVRLPEDLQDRVRDGVAVSAYRLKTVPLRRGRRLTIGCVGDLTLRATGLKAGERAALDLLAAYAFWTGSGHHTGQGLGMTRWVARET